MIVISQNNNTSGKVSSDDTLIKDFVETNQQIFLSAGKWRELKRDFCSNDYITLSPKYD